MKVIYGTSLSYSNGLHILYLGDESEKSDYYHIKKWFWGDKPGIKVKCFQEQWMEIIYSKYLKHRQ